MMKWNELLSDERLGGALEKNCIDEKYENTEFEKDYRRIVSSASFRNCRIKRKQKVNLKKKNYI